MTTPRSPGCSREDKDRQLMDLSTVPSAGADADSSVARCARFRYPSRSVPSPDANGSDGGARPVDKPFFLVVGARIAWHRSQNRGTDALQRSFTRVALGAGRTPSTPTKREEKISKSRL